MNIVSRDKKLCILNADLLLKLQWGFKMHER